MFEARLGRVGALSNDLRAKLREARARWGDAAVSAFEKLFESEMYLWHALIDYRAYAPYAFGPHRYPEYTPKAREAFGRLIHRTTKPDAFMTRLDNALGVADGWVRSVVPGLAPIAGLRRPELPPSPPAPGSPGALPPPRSNAGNADDEE